MALLTGTAPRQLLAPAKEIVIDPIGREAKFRSAK
jgi:hypothetical protein